MTLNVNYMDLGIIALLFLSIFIGFFRGFTREVLGIMGWLGALFASLFGLEYVRPYVKDYISNPFLADLTAAIFLFISVLLILTMISRSISNCIKGSALGGIDRSLGLVFGLARGIFVLCVAYAVTIMMWKPHKWPEVLKTSRTLDIVEQGSEKILDLIPDEVAKNLGVNPSKILRKRPASLSSDEMTRYLSQPEPKS